MKTKKILVNEKIVSISVKDQTIDKKSLCVTINNQEYEAKIVCFNQEKKLLFFEVNNHPYKAKVIATKSGQLSLYLFNSQKNLSVSFEQEEPAFIPSSLTTISQDTQAQKSPQKVADLTLKSPLAGRVIKVLVSENQPVTMHQPIVIIESMKMENEICAPYNAFIKTLSITEGNLVQQNQVLVTFGGLKKEIEGECDGATKNEYGETTIQNR